jgi:hypothetical protein
VSGTQNPTGSGEPGDEDPGRRVFGTADRERLGIGVIVVVILAIAAVFALITARFVIASGLLIIAVLWFAMTRLGARRDRRQPIAVAENDDRVRRILVLSHEGLGGDELTRHVEGRSNEHGSVHVLVLVPALASTLDQLAGDIDDQVGDAESGGDRIVATLRESGVEAEARTGDSDSDQALEDALSTYPADEIVVVNPRHSEMGKVEHAATARAHVDTPIPVTELHV